MPQYSGVWTLEQQAQAQSNQQWVTDPNFKNTTLLLQADGAANTAQNNLFLDTSSNQFAITRNGNTTQGSFSPFSQAPGYWGNYFNGGSSIAAPANTLDFIHQCTANWTLEFWFNASGTGNQSIISTTTTGSLQIGFFVVLNNRATGDIEIQITRGSSGNVYAVYTNGSAWTTNTWNHVAFTFNTTGTAFAIFINGVQQTVNTVGTPTFSGSNASGAPTIGGTTNNVLYYTGYLSNLRAVNGTRVYTSSFTPQTTPLTAVTNTSLLTCQSNRFLDNSTNNYAITTASGTPSVQAFGPFAPALQWTPDVVGGSGYFDGTGDYLSLASVTALQPAASDYTMEVWIYTSSTANQVFYANEASGALGFQFAVETNQSLTMALSSNGTSYGLVLSSTGLLKLGQWNHIAAVRSGSGTNNIAIYLNGVRDATTGTFSGTVNAPSTTFQVGCRYASGATAPLNGYMGGIRFIKGQALYTASTITIPTGPFTTTGYGTTNQSITGAVNLLINYTNAGIYDGKMANNLETVGNAQVATSPVKYGSGSMYFDGTGDYLITNSQVNPIGFGLGDWTIEFWLYLNSTGTQVIFDGRRTSASDVAPMIYYLSGLKYYTAGNDRITGGTLSTGQWYHIAVCRSGTSTKMFIDGTQTGSTYTDTNSYVQQSQRPTIGAEGVTIGNSPLNAYIDDLRVSKVARYFTTFTPPQQALPRQ